MSPARIAKKLAFLTVYLAAMFGLLYGGLKVVDRFAGRRATLTEGLDTESSQLTIRSLELYPYDGYHVQANFSHHGPMPWELHTPDAQFDVRTGDKGYFIDFSLENPPPKAANEIRIILIGGSGAQGWGATRNERMFYAVLERTLNRKVAPLGMRVRVINLAMGASITYQNYISLNQWGHALGPDLILAYVGRNDFYVPLAHSQGTDAYFSFGDVNMLAVASRGSEYPKGMAWLMDLMPNVMRRTSIGLGIKLAWGWDYFKQRSWQSYMVSRGQRIISVRQVFDENVVPMLIHALRSIKRDFDGVPIMVAWQPIREEIGVFQGSLGAGFYDRMYERTKRETESFLNDRWFYFNLHQLSWSIPQGVFRFHLDEKAHEIAGNLLADRIGAIMPVLLEDRGQRLARGLPTGYGGSLVPWKQ